MAENLRAVLKSQYHASLAMLKDAIEKCPDENWTGGNHPRAFWHVAYHALFYAHLYLQPDLESFRPWAQHREDYQFLEPGVPWPPHHPPRIGAPYTRQEVLEYWHLCDAMIDAGVEALKLDAPESGFFWYKMPKLEHQFVNIRHIQHHAAQLADRVRLAANVGVEWVGAKS